MALETAQGTFSVTSGDTSNQTVSLSGFNGETPKVVFLWAESEGPFGLQYWSWGLATGTSNRMALGSGQSEDGNSTIRPQAFGSDSHCLYMHEGGLRAAMDLVSFGADEFVVVMDDAFESNTTVHYLALGGSDIDVAQGTDTVTDNSTGGTQTVSSLGIDPNGLILVAPVVSGGGNTGVSYSLGIADGTTEYVVASEGVDDAATSDTRSWMRTDRTLSRFPSEGGSAFTETNGLSFSSFGTGSFSLTIEATTVADWTYGYLAIEATNLAVVTQALQTSTGNFSNTSLSFTPDTLITFGLIGHTATESSPADHNNIVVGAVDSGGDEGSVAFVDEDGVTSVNVSERNSATHIISGYEDPTEANHTSLVEVQHVSMNSDGWTWNQTDADAVASLFGVLALGAGGAAATTLTADAGSYAISGSAADLERALLMSGDAGSYSLSGAAADLERSLLMSGDAGSYSVSGSAADLLRALLMSGDAGSYSLTGANADLLRALLMSGDAGSYSVSGAAATLSRAIILTADAGSYAISGNAADLLRALILTGDAGSYSLSGAAATLIVSGDVTMTADAGSYSVSGSAADLLRDLLMSADAGGYTVTGSTADLIRSLVMNANAGVYQVTGSTADLLRDLLMDAEAGSFVISGQDATLTATGAEVDLQPPFTAVWIDPERGSVWIAVAKGSMWVDIDKDAQWE